MIDAQIVETLVREYLSKHAEYELITCTVSKDNNILVEVDSYNGVDLDFCAEMNRHLQAELDKTAENYELEVGSVSLTAPFKTLMQYNKHIGDDVEVLTKAEDKGKGQSAKYKGVLVNAEPEYFEIDTEVLVPVEGKKKKERRTEPLRFGYDEVQYCRYDLKI